MALKLRTDLISKFLIIPPAVLTSLISLIAIQLFPLSTRSSNSRGARGKKSCGLRQPNSHTTLTIAAVTLGSSPSSISRSFILGHAGLRVSGYTNANRYKVTIVFLRTPGWECVNRGRRSERTERARDGVIMWGSVMMGRDIVVTAVEVKSWGLLSAYPRRVKSRPYLLQQIRSQHQDFGIWSEALNRPKISDSFLQVFRGRHDF